VNDIPTYPVAEFAERMAGFVGVSVADLGGLSERMQAYEGRHRADIRKLDPVSSIATFASWLAQQRDGFVVYADLVLGERIVQLSCIEAAISFKKCVEMYPRVVVTSGTLSPLGFYPRLLEFEPTAMAGFGMSLSRRCLLPLIITRDTTQVTSAFSKRSDERVAQNYGNMLFEFVKIVPDGVVVFFPSYVYLRLVLEVWNRAGLFGQLLRRKLVFIESKSAADTASAFQNYKRAIDCGRGAVFIGVARGRISEGIDLT
jgi:DNA excision repair protein ERCC-2